MADQSNIQDILLPVFCLGAPLLVMIGCVVYYFYNKNKDKIDSIEDKKPSDEGLSLQIGKRYGFMCYGKRMMGRLLRVDEQGRDVEYHFLITIHGIKRPTKFLRRSIEYIYQVFDSDLEPKKQEVKNEP